MEEQRELYRQLTDLGSFYGTQFNLDVDLFKKELASIEANQNPWVFYNSRKPNFNRWGLSLTSLDGGTSGIPDLDSIKEWNAEKKQSLTEMSFRTLTPYWNQLTSLSSRLSSFVPHLGRSHILKLGECGAFPPHRDLGMSFRLISFLSGDASNVYFVLNGQKLSFARGKVYFLDTRLEHSVYSFIPEAYILVMNIEITAETVRHMYRSLEAT